MQTESLVNMIIKIWGILIVSQLLFGYWNILNESLCIGINNHTVYVKARLECDLIVYLTFFNLFFIFSFWHEIQPHFKRNSCAFLIPLKHHKYVFI